MYPFNTIVLKDIVEGFALNRKAICMHIVSLLPKDNSLIKMDLKDARLIPSLAYDLIGSLIAHLGTERFRQQVTFLNPSESQLALLCHVIARQMAMAEQQQATLAE